MGFSIHAEIEVARVYEFSDEAPEEIHYCEE